MSEHWDWPGAHVERIIDGDTFVAVLTRDLGFHGTATFEQRLRLNRINAKPAKTEEGKRATARVTVLTTATSVGIETVSPYKYRDEWMAEVTLADGRNLSDLLVAEDLAVYWDGEGTRPDA